MEDSKKNKGNDVKQTYEDRVREREGEREGGRGRGREGHRGVEREWGGGGGWREGRLEGKT